MNALLIINLQNDFMPWGTVPVEGSDQLAEKVNQIMDQYDEVIAIQSWYPADHIRFAANHIWRKPGQTIDVDGSPVLLWNMHCVQDSFGAELVSDLDFEKINKVIKKGTNKRNANYSAFENADKELVNYLKEKNISKVFLTGLISGFDIKHTALDAEKLGFQVSVLSDLCKGIETGQGEKLT